MLRPAIGWAFFIQLQWWTGRDRELTVVNMMRTCCLNFWFDLENSL